MDNSIIQVRGVPESVVAALRDRASRQGVSLSAYVRDLLTEDASAPTMAEVIEQISRREPVEVSDDEILAAIHEGRR